MADSYFTYTADLGEPNTTDYTIVADDLAAAAKQAVDAWGSLVQGIRVATPTEAAAEKNRRNAMLVATITAADRVRREAANAKAIELGRRVAEMMQARDDGDRALEEKLSEALMDEYLASDANGRMQPGQWMDQAFFAWEESDDRAQAVEAAAKARLAR